VGNSRVSRKAGGGAPWQSRHSRQPVEDLRWSIFPDSICSLWKAHAGADEKCEKEGVAERNHYVLTILSPSPPCAAWLGGVGVWSEVEPQRG